MNCTLTPLGEEARLTAAQLEAAVEDLLLRRRPRLRLLWTYHQNPMRLCTLLADDSGSHRPYRQGQEWGLPSRITGVRAGCDTPSPQPVVGVARKEIVIENDIRWRVETMVDYLFGKPIVVDSAAPDPARRILLTSLIRALLAANGGLMFLQQLALLGAIYGFVDVLVKIAPGASGPAEHPSADPRCALQSLGQPPAQDQSADRDPPPGPASAPDSTDAAGFHRPLDANIAGVAKLVRLEIVEPARALPFMSLRDYRQLRAYAQVYDIPAGPDATAADASAAAASRPGLIQRLRQRAGALLAPAASSAPRSARDSIQVVELISPSHWQRRHDGRVVAQGENPLGEIPLVHIQNTAVPFEYAGQSEVEPLIPLQDELNTRLCDRANRVTLQSFKMYLGKGIDNFNDQPISPGRMWATDNTDADVIEFGGDSNAPSESLHIQDVREAMDKISAVTPIAAGAIKGRIGRLTSAAALRITLLSLLSKTEKKRIAYGAAIGRMVSLALAWLDRAQLFHTLPEERAVEIHWPSALPENEVEKLQEAQMKAALGIPREVILKELGY